ncbi:MAG TPA: preprotein translocase subunit SecY [Candidatus Azoamicus sp.]
MTSKFFEKNNNINDLRNRLLFVFLILIIYRLGAHIPVPLVDAKQILNSFSDDNAGIFSLFNLFSGGALSKITVFSLGIMPYISSSIIIQLLSTIWDPMIKLKKEGDFGRKRISDYTRFLTVVLSSFQAIAMAKIVINFSSYSNFNFLFYAVIVFTLVAGTIFLMWLGELINENGIGNGMSLIIFTSIVSNLPRSIGSTLEKIRQGELNIIVMFLFLIVLFLVIFLIIFVERAQKKITINYPKRQQGKKVFAAQTTFLPFKINMAGVIPPIFASSLILFPITLIQWIDPTSSNFILNGIRYLITPGKLPYLFLFALFIVFFCFFYTSLVFKSSDTSDNLKKSGGFISGIRPGDNTTIYIDKVVKKLTILGACYLTFVSLLPEFLVAFLNVPFYFGGTSLLIIIVVIMDFISQIQSKMISYKYDGLIKKYKLNGF